MSVRFDTIVSTLPILADKIIPGYTFSFGVTYQNNNYKVVFFKDYSHRFTPDAFIKAEASSLDEAAELLMMNFLDWVESRSKAQDVELAKARADAEIQYKAIESVLMEIKSLKAM